MEQTPFDTNCLLLIDYIILICHALIVILIIIPVFLIVGKLTIHLGLNSFGILRDSINGVIDFGVPEGMTILHMSAHAGNSAGCQKILKWKPEYINKITINGKNAFSFAARKGHTATCEAIVEKLREGCVCMKDSGEIYICRKCCDVIKMATNQDKFGLTALHHAVEGNHPETVNYLVNHELFGNRIVNMLSYNLQKRVPHLNGIGINTNIKKAVN